MRAQFDHLEASKIFEFLLSSGVWEIRIIPLAFHGHSISRALSKRLKEFKNKNDYV